jgi:molybdopterin converting factor small subunit
LRNIQSKILEKTLNCQNIILIKNNINASLEILKGTVVLSINENYVVMDQNVDLKNNDEIAVIPPLSGG